MSVAPNMIATVNAMPITERCVLVAGEEHARDVEHQDGDDREREQREEHR